MTTVLIEIDDSIDIGKSGISWIVDLVSKRINDNQKKGRVTHTNTPAKFDFSVITGGHGQPQTLVPIKYTGTPEQKQSIPYGKYIVVRKDGKTHMETFNGTGWAYNNSVIEWFYMPKNNAD